MQFERRKMALRRKDGSVVLFNNSEFISAFYSIPLDILLKHGHEAAGLPRKLSELIKDPEAVEMVESDYFLNAVIDSYAEIVWPHMGNSAYMEIYSGFDPAWRIAHALPYWTNWAEFLDIISGETELVLTGETERPFPSMRIVDLVIGTMVRFALKKDGLDVILKAVEEHRCFEDFSELHSRQKIDFYRKWYHTRTQHPQISLEGFQEEYAETHNGKQWDAPDESADLAETVESSAFVEDFLKTLSPTDRRIVELRMEDVTLEEIAKEVGFKTHSAVLKRLKRIGKLYREYDKED